MIKLTQLSEADNSCLGLLINKIIVLDVLRELKVVGNIRAFRQISSDHDQSVSPSDFADDLLFDLDSIVFCFDEKLGDFLQGIEEYHPSQDVEKSCSNKFISFEVIFNKYKILFESLN